MAEPGLYNWVRAISKISLLSACYSLLVIIACPFLGFYLSENNSRPALNLSLLAALISTIILTTGIRKICINKLVKNSHSSLSYELLLATWCILLVLLHFQCQLVNLLIASQQTPLTLTIVLFLSSLSVIFFNWPTLTKIQKLLAAFSQTKAAK